MDLFCNRSNITPPEGNFNESSFLHTWNWCSGVGSEHPDGVSNKGTQEARVTL